MRRLLYIAVLTLLFCSCKKELDFEYHTIDPLLVIEGQLTQYGCETSLTYTTPMNEYMDTTHVKNAEVILKDLTDGRLYSLKCEEDGIFRDKVSGVETNTYELEINYQGKSYTSTCVMRPPTEIISLGFNWLKMPYDYVAILKIRFKELPGNDSYYWIKIYRNGDAYQWLLCDNRSASKGEITQMTMTSRKNIEDEDEKDILRDGDIIGVDISTISKEMYEYISALRMSSNGPRMFEGDFCLGYFLASGTASDTIVFHPDSLATR